MTILVVRHIPDNSLGHLEDILAAHGLPFVYAEARSLTDTQLELWDLQGLILLGGKESLTEDHKHHYLQREQHMVRNAIAEDVPVFGICLGSQMIARSLGAPVVRLADRNGRTGDEAKEIGWTPLGLSPEGKADPVISSLEGMPQFQWHEDTYHLPPGAVHLAHSELCPEQAYRLEQGNCVYAVQFHPEVTRKVIADWLAESESLPAGRKQAIWEETEASFAVRHEASRKMFDTWCSLAFG